MELKNILNKKIQRKNFFLTIGAGAGSYFLVRSLPFKFFGRLLSKPKSISGSKIKVKINPSAVSRKKV